MNAWQKVAEAQQEQIKFLQSTVKTLADENERLRSRLNENLSLRRSIKEEEK